jgi:hypothetical protein
MITFKQYLTEGGNVFKGKTGSIDLANIEPTLNSYFAELKKLFPLKANIFDTKHCVPLGSVGKKPTSGDIDLGIDVKSLLDQKMSDESIKLWNIDPKAVKAESDSLAKRARSATPQQLRMKAFLKLLTLYINAHSPNLYCDEKKVTDGNIFGLYPQINPKGKKLPMGVQIDWMVGNLEWLKFSYYSAAYPSGSNVKGLHRTQLMLAAFQIAEMSFGHVGGVKSKATSEIIAQDPKTALKVLGDELGFPITANQAEDYYKLHSLLKAKLKGEQYKRLLKIYFKILDSTRADIPDDMQADWVKMKDELGLTGKFLPDNSKLKEFV